MIKKEYRVFNTFDYPESGGIVHDYTITVSENDKGEDVWTLLRSYNPVWTDHVKGEEVISIINTGNEYIIPKQFSGKVAYDKASELFILLKFINNQDPLYSGFIEEIIHNNQIKI